MSMWQTSAAAADLTGEEVDLHLPKRQTAIMANNLHELSRDWAAMSADASAPMEQFGWASACAHAFAPGEELYLPAVRRDGRAVAIAPLRWKSIHGVRHGLMLGVEELHEPTDLVYRDEKALRMLVEALIDEGQPLILDRLPANSPTVRLFAEIGQGRAVVICRPKPPCPFIPLDNEWLEPDRKLNAGRRSDLRRARRRAAELGRLDVEILSPAEADLEPLLEEAFDIEASGWKGQARTALKYDPQRAQFYRIYARWACRMGILRLCFLRIGGVRAAMQMAVQTAGGFWLLKIGYHVRFARCSPGLLLMRETIRHAARQGLNYEFLGICAPWIQVWTRHVRPCVSLRVYPMNLRGTAALAGEAAGALLRRCMTR